MSHKFFSQVLTVGLALVLQAPAAIATPTVSGTTGTGYAGGTVTTTLTIAFDNSLDATQVLGWDFKLNWGSAPLTLDTASSTISIDGGTTTVGLDAFVATVLATSTVATSNTTDYSFSWLDDNLVGINLSPGISFNGVFNIGAAASVGTYDIGFAVGAGGSSFTDANANTFEYSAVTTGQNPMQVTVLATPTHQVPEPGTLSMLGLALAGASLVIARKRHSKQG